MQPSRVPVEEYTTAYAITAHERMPIDELRQLMNGHGIRHLPVLRGEAVVGVISDRDLRLVDGLSSPEKLQILAGDIMATDPLTVVASTPLDDVALAMSQQKVGSAIVTTTDGRFLGIFTATDALNALVEVVRRSAAA